MANYGRIVLELGRYIYKLNTGKTRRYETLGELTLNKECTFTGRKLVSNQRILDKRVLEWYYDISVY